MRIILSFLILLSAIILTAENWWMHVIKPDNYTEHWLFKAGFKDKRLIPISTFIVGVLTVLILRTQLNKRIDARNLETLKVSVVNNVCYLEKT